MEPVISTPSLDLLILLEAVRARSFYKFRRASQPPLCTRNCNTTYNLGDHDQDPPTMKWRTPLEVPCVSPRTNIMLTNGG
ncbi:hypothetical protein LX32DRAFT_323027 [Colletotrichum zoysiae]|uniref:Uncharacterized protein n=1 Tax=Colletotrichum zoysiae TaxID=1216348 RepID=A0AAD9LU63_9PEZI|nr:hypothetical protein LX32DRAFT_323027 [Colletotrichum zoysiae]